MDLQKELGTRSRDFIKFINDIAIFSFTSLLDIWTQHMNNNWKEKPFANHQKVIRKFQRNNYQNAAILHAFFGADLEILGYCKSDALSDFNCSHIYRIEWLVCDENFVIFFVPLVDLHIIQNAVKSELQHSPHRHWFFIGATKWIRKRLIRRNIEMLSKSNLKIKKNWKLLYEKFAGILWNYKAEVWKLFTYIIPRNIFVDI